MTHALPALDGLDVTSNLSCMIDVPCCHASIGEIFDLQYYEMGKKTVGSGGKQ